MATLDTTTGYGSDVQCQHVNRQSESAPKANREIDVLSKTMLNKKPDRLLIISSRVSENYELTGTGAKHLQHIFTAWFPRAVYHDLTDDTVRVDVVVRMGVISKKNVFDTTFLTDGGTTIKTMSYDEDRIVGRRCDQYLQNKTRYNGQKDGLDFRHVYYTASRSPLR